MPNHGKLFGKYILGSAILVVSLAGGVMIVGPILPQQAGTVRGEPVRQVSLEKVLRDEIAEQQHRHERRLEQLESLKKGLQSADAREAQVEELDRLIAEETRDYRARIAFLRQISRPVLSEGELPQSRLRSTVGSELHDLAQAIGSLNQSYVIAPSVGPGAATGGSGFIDYEDVAEEPRVVRPADEDAPLHVPRAARAAARAGASARRGCMVKCPAIGFHRRSPTNWRGRSSSCEPKSPGCAARWNNCRTARPGRKRNNLPCRPTASGKNVHFALR